MEDENQQEPIEQEPTLYKSLLEMEGKTGGDYNNINASIAISAGATTIIAIGTPMLMAEKPLGVVLVVIGLIVYFVKAYLLKKGCI